MNTETTPPPAYNERSFRYALPSEKPPTEVQQQQPMPQSAAYGQMMMPFSEHPVQCVCPKCGAMIVTRTEKHSGLCSWLLCGCLVIIGCWLCCCLIPFCINATKDTVHYCPNCATPIGTKNVI